MIWQVGKMDSIAYIATVIAIVVIIVSMVEANNECNKDKVEIAKAMLEYEKLSVVKLDKRIEILKYQAELERGNDLSIKQ